MSPQNNPERFLALDSWRGICACLVALMHMPTAGYLSSVLGRNAFYYVDFFFVLSGFVIAHAYLERLRIDNSLTFIWNRLARLLPLHVAILFVYVGFEYFTLWSGFGDPDSPPFSGQKSFRYLTGQFLLLHGLGIHDDLSWNGPSWSISTELTAYMVFALITLFIRRLDKWIYLFIVLSFPVILWQHSTSGMDVTYDCGLIRCLYGFSMGVLLRKVYPLFKDAVMFRRYPTAMEFLAVVSTFTFVYFAGRSAVGFVAPVMFSVVIAIFSLELGRISQWLKHPFPIALGAFSYSIYMVHSFIHERFFNTAHLFERFSRVELLYPMQTDRYVVKAFGPAWWIGDAVSILMLVVVVSASLMTYRYIEKPTRNWAKQVRFGASRQDI